MRDILERHARSQLGSRGRDLGRIGREPAEIGNQIAHLGGRGLHFRHQRFFVDYFGYVFLVQQIQFSVHAEQLQIELAFVFGDAANGPAVA